METLEYQEILETMLDQIIRIRVYGEWATGLLIACFVVLIIIVFATFMSTYSR